MVIETGFDNIVPLVGVDVGVESCPPNSELGCNDGCGASGE